LFRSYIRSKSGKNRDKRTKREKMMNNKKREKVWQDPQKTEKTSEKEEKIKVTTDYLVRATSKGKEIKRAVPPAKPPANIFPIHTFTV
jgi:hypothetical protein